MSDKVSEGGGESRRSIQPVGGDIWALKGLSLFPRRCCKMSGGTDPLRPHPPSRSGGIPEMEDILRDYRY